ncbi:hypothetical protein ACIBBD_36345 [Streptomyces sp. NPDC051315]|uniref:hypothetical protein n=1 Tax=Streptomyces sp. NPDC051315 TaxID=3365650 RepID=UPI00379AF5A2
MGDLLAFCFSPSPSAFGAFSLGLCRLSFGAFSSGLALLDVAFGRARAEGRLPFEPPRSMAAVEASRPDVPNDTRDPVFPYGHGVDLP